MKTCFDSCACSRVCLFFLARWSRKGEGQTCKANVSSHPLSLPPFLSLAVHKEEKKNVLDLLWTEKKKQERWQGGKRRLCILLEREIPVLPFIIQCTVHLQVGREFYWTAVQNKGIWGLIMEMNERLLAEHNSKPFLPHWFVSGNARSYQIALSLACLHIICYTHIYLTLT